MPTAPVTPVTFPVIVNRTATAPNATGFITPGYGSAGTAPAAAGRQTTATAGRIQLLSPNDAPLLKTAFGELAKSTTGKPVLDALQAHGARIAVLSDAEFARLGHEDSGAWFDPQQDIMYVRRDWLQKNPVVTASAIAHEAVHAIDDASGLLQDAKDAKARALAALGGEATPALVESRVAQAMWELSIAAETRAFVIQGQILRELGQAEKAAGPIAIAAQGANDRATYDRVFAGIVAHGGSAYNPDDRTAAPFAL